VSQWNATIKTVSEFTHQSTAVI